jgi:hypothetical protein
VAAAEAETDEEAEDLRGDMRTPPSKDSRWRKESKENISLKKRKKYTLAYFSFFFVIDPPTKYFKTFILV